MAVKDANMAARSRKPIRPWYIREAQREQRMSMSAEEREAAFKSFIARHGKGAGKGRA